MVSKSVGNVVQHLALILIRVSSSRAKIKLLAKKSIETGEDCDAIPESMRQYLMQQAMESGKPIAGDLFGRTPHPMSSYGNGTLINPESSNPGKVGKSSQWDCRSDLGADWKYSYPSLYVQILEYRNVASCGSKCYGFGHLLCA